MLGNSATAPYALTWNSTTVPDGAHTFFVRGLDTVGNVATSASVTVTVDNTGPTVAITSPANGARVARRATITIAANASDPSGVAKVEFLVGGVLRCTDTTAPYTCTWTVPNSMTTHSIQAKAYDSRNNIAARTISVNAR